MRGRLLFILLAAIVLLFAPLLPTRADALPDEVVTIDTRPGVTQSFLLIRPEGDIKGVVLMFPAHEGVVEFEKNGAHYHIKHEGGGLTIREEARETYRKNGLVVAIVALPSDRVAGINTAFRSSDAHFQDVRGVLGYLKEMFGQKVYLHGHCRASFSPASIITKLKNEGIAGMILSSARSTGKHGAVMDYEPGIITVPVLLVQHTDDPCNGTPYANLGAVKSFYEQSAEKVDVILVSGGDMRKHGTNSCQAGPHSFRDLEGETSQAIANWILGKAYETHIKGPERW